jgi:23S rRNA pseudouridine1911/1915/1917 synthase
MKTIIDILFEDEHMVVVNKPALMLSIPDRFDPEKPNLHHWLEQHLGCQIWVVHRLDRETSGAICFAKSEEAHRHLSQQFENREVEKIYLALVDGIPHPAAGVIDKPIAHSLSQPGKMVVNAKGKPAVTEYKVIESFKAFSLVEADIKTGRTHQVRVHMQSIGHPLAIDPLYGKRAYLMLSEIKRQAYKLSKEEDERPLMSRHTLHAQQLRLQHPVTGDIVQVEALLPKDFKAVVQQLGKWG